MKLAMVARSLVVELVEGFEVEAQVGAVGIALTYSPATAGSSANWSGDTAPYRPIPRCAARTGLTVGEECAARTGLTVWEECREDAVGVGERGAAGAVRREFMG